MVFPTPLGPSKYKLYPFTSTCKPNSKALMPRSCPIPDWIDSNSSVVSNLKRFVGHVIFKS